MNNLVWTTEYPTKPGHYWMRNYLRAADPEWEKSEEATPGPDIIQIDNRGGFYETGSDMTRDRSNIASAEWYGPLEPPA